MLMMQKRMLMLVALVALVGGGLLVPATAQAGGVAKVRVEVVSGVRGGKGMDDSAKKHDRVLSRLGGFGGWKVTSSFALKVDLGGSAKKAVGPRTFTATLHSLSTDKARTAFVVTDPAGKKHSTTSSLGKGGSTVLVAESADGSELHAFIIRVDF